MYRLQCGYNIPNDRPKSSTSGVVFMSLITILWTTTTLMAQSRQYETKLA